LLIKLTGASGTVRMIAPFPEFDIIEFPYELTDIIFE
jgi:hypothetical protein